MDLMRFRSWNSLKIFGTVARYESITIVAEELCQSKGAVSYQINKLEKELGFMLFDRTKSKLALCAMTRIQVGELFFT